MRMVMTLKGVDKLTSSLIKVQRTLMGTAEGALEEVAEKLMEESKAQVPFDTGTLVSTDHIADVAYPSDDEVSIVMGYAHPESDAINPETGTPASWYAIDVHEDLGVQHVVGKAKFLEDPVTQGAEFFQSRLATTLRDTLGQGSWKS